MNLCRRNRMGGLLLASVASAGILMLILPRVVLGAGEEASKLFAGKEIKIIVGYSPGGGFDTVARIIARHLSKHIPGNPRILVDNMTGAGGAVAFNYVYSRSKPDGLTWVSSDGALVQSKILGLPGPDFDVEKYPWLGAPIAASDVCVVMSRTGIKDTNQFLHSEKPIRIGSTAIGDSIHMRPLAAGEAVGANFRIILGYGGTADILLALRSGEVDAGCWSWAGIRMAAADLLKTKEANLVLQITLEKQPDLPDVPNIFDFPMSEEARLLLRFVLSPALISHLYAVPPGTPQPVVDILRRGLADTLKDPDLLADAKKVNMPISQTSSEQITKIVKEMVSTPLAIKNKALAMACPKCPPLAK